MKVLSVDGLSKLITLMKEDFALSSSLSTVATSGDYNDLVNKPTIPEGLPSQSGNSGKFLTTNGSAASWATVTQPSIATTSTAGLVKPDGTTITITNDGTISVPEAVFIKNENTTPSEGLTIQGSTKNLAGINIGLSSVITAATAIAIGKSSNAGSNAVALGNLSAATGTCSIALGTNAKATTEYTISIGCFSTNYTTTRYTLNFGFGGNYTYTLLDGLTGLIPDARISTNIARTSQIPSTANMQTTTNLVTSLSSSSTDTQYPSAKCVYDLIGDIETTINTIRGI